ncbi:MAG: sulfur carrier protein ThiS [Syntrophomonadaceae bacterium]|jgi:sulfur carrier protein|nr:sulfur carrier protein ThiS [Syntrophomonadaceae bacterium]
MLVVVNRREENLPEGMSLAEFIGSKGLEPGEFIFILNEFVIEREQVGSIILKENDRLEVLRFVGGG